MHSYSIDSDIRTKVYVALGVIAFALPAWVDGARTLFGLPITISYPLSFGVSFGLLHFLFDRWFWKLLSHLGVLPNFNGAWRVEGISSYDGGASFSGDVKIRQTFSLIEVFGDFPASTSRSTLAGVCVNHAVPIFRYVYDNTPKNLSNEELQRHPGLIELRLVSKSEMQGDYFSGKHRVRHGEMTLRRADAN